MIIPLGCTNTPRGEGGQSPEGSMTTLLFPFLSFPSSRVNQPLFSIFFVSIFFQIYIQSLVRGKRIRSGDKFCRQSGSISRYARYDDKHRGRKSDCERNLVTKTALIIRSGSELEEYSFCKREGGVARPLHIIEIRLPYISTNHYGGASPLG